jgi:hypothetical protein
VITEVSGISRIHMVRKSWHREPVFTDLYLGRSFRATVSANHAKKDSSCIPARLLCVKHSVNKSSGKMNFLS